MGRQPRVRTPEVKGDMNLVKLVDQFGSEDRCRAYLEDLRWPDGIRCPRCEGTTISRIVKRNQFDCDSCRYQFSVTAGTIFHDSHLPLWKWFLAIYMMVESKKGISANQLKRSLDVSYKTAWYLCHRIRDAMGDDDQTPLEGIVEADETWVGGKRKHVGQGYVDNKTLVAGVIQRGADVRLKVVPSSRRKDLHAFLKAHVADGAIAIYTDELASYEGIGDGDTIHESVNHRQEEWVRGNVHTNTAESVWSLFKRSIIGSYHHMSAKHLAAYLDELEWRFNGRENPFLFRDTLQLMVNGEALPYRTLVGGPSLIRLALAKQQLSTARQMLTHLDHGALDV